MIRPSGKEKGGSIKPELHPMDCVWLCLIKVGSVR